MVGGLCSSRFFVRSGFAFKAVSKALTLQAFMFNICVRVYFVLYLNLCLGCFCEFDLSVG